MGFAASPWAKATTTAPSWAVPLRSHVRRRADLEAIHRAGVEAVEPGQLVARNVERRGTRLAIDLGERTVHARVDALFVAGAGKAAVAMAEAVARIAPEVPGVVVAPPGRHGPVGRIEVLRGSHPVPDRSSFRSTDRLLRRLRRRPAGDTVLFLLSGGASALLARPAPGVAPADKIRLGRLLLRWGADIELTNMVRKHVSAVKGGGILRAVSPRRVVSLVLSDVIGDPLPTIGSGPTVPDPSTYEDAWRGLEGLGVLEQLPPTIRARLRAGRAGLASARETVKPATPEARRSLAAVIGSNRIALRAAAAAARRLGYRVRTRSRPLAGDAAAAAGELVRSLGAPVEPQCVLAGGETTVDVGDQRGVGGRNQEFAVAAMRPLAGRGWSLLAAGTDGIDGQTPAAGGLADGTSLRRAGTRRVSRALREHDSHRLLAALGDTLTTGPTGTNVMDLVVALGGPEPE